MKDLNKTSNLLMKIKKLASKPLTLINTLKICRFFIKVPTEERFIYVKCFINEYYQLSEDLPDDFYNLVIELIYGEKYLVFFDILEKRDIYLLISYLKYDLEDASELIGVISPLDYFRIPKRYINFIINLLKSLELQNKDNTLNSSIKRNFIWLIKRNPTYLDSEYLSLAYKIYLSIGLDNAIELLSEKYGRIDYEKVYFLFNNLNVSEFNIELNNAFNRFLFDNKKDPNNIMRQMLNGAFDELFINFDYFYNDFSYFANKLGLKMSKSKVKALLKERFLARDVMNPEVAGDIFEDMIASYYNRYGIDEKESEVLKRYFKAYNEQLRKKTSSSIPCIKLNENEGLTAEIIPLTDARNLVMGYRAGNCFRINGNAFMLFADFLSNLHMRLISISSADYKDYAMMLVMRNGNALISQGIEVSKRVPDSLKGRKLYDTCKMALSSLQSYMNANGDEIVATIIGRTNDNVSYFNNDILPFVINPLILTDDKHNFYNGIDNYQCLLDLQKGKTLNDIKLFVPKTVYTDKRPKILRRTKGDYSIYREVEKILISLRFQRLQTHHDIEAFEFYRKLSSHKEFATSCNIDWYITLFEDGFIDSYISTDNKEANDEFSEELKKINALKTKLNSKL